MYLDGRRGFSPRHTLAAAAVAAMVVVLLGATDARAEDGPNTGNISIEVTADVYTEYWFRGIPQEDQGFIFQPAVTITAGLIANEDFTLDIYGGTWNSLHSDQSGSSGNGPGHSWYESDAYFGATLGFGNVSIDVAYIFYYGPNASALFAEEIAVTFGYDDLSLWPEDFVPGWNGLRPYATVAFEVDGGADFGGTTQASEGTYLEFGIEPGFTLVQSESYPINLSFPLTVGLGIEDYYEHPGPVGAGTNEDEDFGFFSIGVHATMPLSFIPSSYGDWSIHAGVDFIFLNDDFINSAAGPSPNDYDENRIVGSFGIGFTY